MHSIHVIQDEIQYLHTTEAETEQDKKCRVVSGPLVLSL